MEFSICADNKVIMAGGRKHVSKSNNSLGGWIDRDVLVFNTDKVCRVKLYFVGFAWDIKINFVGILSSMITVNIILIYIKLLVWVAKIDVAICDVKVFGIMFGCSEPRIVPYIKIDFGDLEISLPNGIHKA